MRRGLPRKKARRRLERRRGRAARVDDEPSRHASPDRAGPAGAREAPERAVADVAPVVHAVEADVRRRGVGAGHRRRDVGAERRHAQDAAARRRQPAVAQQRCRRGRQ